MYIVYLIILIYYIHIFIYLHIFAPERSCILLIRLWNVIPKNSTSEIIANGKYFMSKYISNIEIYVVKFI